LTCGCTCRLRGSRQGRGVEIRQMDLGRTLLRRLPGCRGLVLRRRDLRRVRALLRPFRDARCMGSGTWLHLSRTLDLHESGGLNATTDRSRIVPMNRTLENVLPDLERTPKRLARPPSSHQSTVPSSRSSIRNVPQPPDRRGGLPR